MAIVTVPSVVKHNYTMIEQSGFISGGLEGALAPPWNYFAPPLNLGLVNFNWLQHDSIDW